MGVEKVSEFNIILLVNLSIITLNALNNFDINKHIRIYTEKLIIYMKSMCRVLEFLLN